MFFSLHSQMYFTQVVFYRKFFQPFWLPSLFLHFLFFPMSCFIHESGFTLTGLSSLHRFTALISSRFSSLFLCDLEGEIEWVLDCMPGLLHLCQFDLGNSLINRENLLSFQHVFHQCSVAYPLMLHYF
jgi:hypothetical protein